MSWSRVRAALRNDLRQQWRYGFWLAYALVALAYLVLLQLVPDAWGVDALLLELIVFSDPAILGFFFIGGLMLLEGVERTREACFVTPLAPGEWLLAKALSLTLLATLASLALALPLAEQLRLATLLLAVIPTSICFVWIGVALGTRCTTVNHYLLAGALVSSPLLLAMLEPLGLVHADALVLLPSGAALQLLADALCRTELSPLGRLARVLVLAGWSALAFAWARAWLVRP